MSKNLVKTISHFNFVSDHAPVSVLVSLVEIGRLLPSSEVHQPPACREHEYGPLLGDGGSPWDVETVAHGFGGDETGEGGGVCRGRKREKWVGILDMQWLK